MTDRNALRLAATLLIVGELVSFLAGIFHPARENPNNHPAVFAEYAASAYWTPIHLGQFAGMAVTIAGLIALFFALRPGSPLAMWMNRIGAISAVVSLALYGVLQAVDGVMLKQAVNAWAAAPEAEKLARFASAELARWLEWGTRSYQSFVFGLSLVLLAVAAMQSERALRFAGYLLALSGAAYIAQGWILGSQGFSTANAIPQLLAYAAFLAWSVWLIIVAWRMKAETSNAGPG